MNTPARPRRAALLCCHFTRNLAYYRAGWNAVEPIFPRTDLWATLNSNFLDIAVIEWCKLFAETKAYYNWRRVVVDPDPFIPQLFADFGATKVEWDIYVATMRTYRDKFLAHLDRRNKMDIPVMDLAQFAIYYLFDTMRAEQVSSVFQGLPHNLREYSAGCKDEASQLYASAT